MWGACGATVTGRAAAYSRMLQRPPVRHFGRPEDVAAMIAYLASGVPAVFDDAWVPIGILPNHEESAGNFVLL